MRQLARPNASNIRMSPDGRPPTFDGLIGPLVGRGYALAVTMLDDRAAAEDAVQEASIKAWRNLASLRDRSAIEPWFLSIVANQCRNVRRGRWWSVLKFPEVHQKISTSDEPIESLDLDRALDRLAPEERLPLFLHFYMDMTFEQVGYVVGVSMTAAMMVRDLAAVGVVPGLVLGVVTAEPGWTGVHAATSMAQRAIAPQSSRRGATIFV
jgi:RNA polymerase sigma-70 factor, ECF subfamily